MKIILFDIQGMSANGIRSISSKLRENGHSLKLVFENGRTYRMFADRDYVYRYKQPLVDEIVEFCKGADMVGFNVMTTFMDRARQLTFAIQSKLRIPVIWGGIHSSSCWDECIKYVDIICVGEGERPLVELANKMAQGTDYFDTKGLVFKKDGSIINNVKNLTMLKTEEIPIQDYDYENHKIIYKGRLVQLTQENMPAFTNYNLQYDASRGCPYRCSYCCNDVYLKLYPNQSFLRIRNLSKVIGELEQILKKLPGYKTVSFTDDDFFVHSRVNLERFASEYKQKIGLPFTITATPANCSTEKLKVLLDIGLTRINFGFQTVNDRLQKIYNRHMSGAKILDIGRDIKNYAGANNKETIHINLDVMLDSPFETHYERLRTIDFLLKLPMNFVLAFFSLSFYPGTSLSRLAIEKGFINEKEKYYNKCIQGPEGNIINMIFYMTGLVGKGRIPRWAVKVLTIRWIFFILNNPVFNFILRQIGKYRYVKKYYMVDVENYI